MRSLVLASLLAVAASVLAACGDKGPEYQLAVEPNGQRYGLICTRMAGESQNFAVTQVEREALTIPYVENYRGETLDCIISIEGGRHTGDLTATMTKDGEEVGKISFGEGYVGGTLNSSGRSSLIEATSGNSAPPVPAGFSEVRAASACDEAAKSSMVSPTSFRTRGMWEWTQGPQPGQATVTRNFTARNAMNAELASRYRCVVDARSYSVISIRTGN